MIHLLLKWSQHAGHVTSFSWGDIIEFFLLAFLNSEGLQPLIN